MVVKHYCLLGHLERLTVAQHDSVTAKFFINFFGLPAVFHPRSANNFKTITYKFKIS
jgi:hypothetical protein